MHPQLLAISNYGDDIDGVDLLGVIVLEEVALGGEIETAGEASPVIAHVPIVAGSGKKKMKRSAEILSVCLMDAESGHSPGAGQDIRIGDLL